MEILQLTDWCFCRYHAVRKSKEEIRYEESQSSWDTNLIVHQGLADVIHQIIKLPCVPGTVQELCNIFLCCHRVQSLVDIL